MTNSIIRPIAVFVITSIFSLVTSAQVDPIVARLDSMSDCMFTRDKCFVNDEQVLNSINLPIEQIPTYTEDEIREKMTLIPAEFAMTYNGQVKSFIDLFAYKRRGLMSRCLANAQIYFPIFEAILDRKGLPLELKYLPIVESAFNPVAVSRAGATGLWQLMYGTGTELGLSVNTYVDERRDPVMATEAAVEYLRKLYSIYGDWHLVLAAYNSGPGNVNKAIARAGGVRNFWAIMNYLPAETRSYVPTFIAAVYVMTYHQDYKIAGSEPKRELYMVDTVMITSKVSLKHISNTLRIPEDELQFLNPSLKRGIIPYTANGFPLNLPVQFFAQFEAKKEEIMNDSSQMLQNTEVIISASPKLIYYLVKRNETINKVAAKYSVSTADIRKWNRLKNSYLYQGQKLKIYTQPPTSATYAQAFAPKVIEKPTTETFTTDSTELNNKVELQLTSNDSKINTNLPKAPKFDNACGCIMHVVQPGDTLWGIAQRYDGMTVDKLKAHNKQYSKSPIKVGDVVKVVM